MSEVKLLPCPFCGGEVEVKSCSSNFFDSVFEIVCRECNCRQAPSIHKEAVINAWNTRKPIEDIVERLENAKEDFREYRDGKLVYEITASVSGINKAIEIVKGGVED